MTDLQDPVDLREPVLLHAEDLHVPERLIAAPAAGVFRAVSGDLAGTDACVREGQVVGTIEVTGDSVPVTSPHDGHLMGLLAMPGERVRAAQPLAWVRTFPTS